MNPSGIFYIKSKVVSNAGQMYLFGDKFNLNKSKSKQHRELPKFQ